MQPNTDDEAVGTVKLVGHPILLGGTLIAAFAAATLTIGGASLSPIALLALLLGGIIIVTSGLVLLRWTAPDAGIPRVSLAMVVGSVTTNVVLLAASLLTGCHAGIAFALWSVLVAGVAVHAFRRSSPAGRVDWREIVSVVVLGVLVAWWCRGSAGALPSIETSGIVPVWSDFFIHGAEIAAFSERLSGGPSSFLLAGQPLVFYHYASYLLPAAAMSVVDLPALGMAASLWLPFGLLLAALGTSALTRTLAGPALGLLVPVALLMMPDASTYGLRNGFFSFHWLLFTNPGSGYGLGAAFAAITLSALWKDGCHRCLWLAVFVTLALFQIRAQFFTLLVPALAATILYETRAIDRYRRLLIFVLLFAVLVFVAGVTAVPSARQAWLSFSAIAPFLEIVHALIAPTAYEGVYRAIEQRCGIDTAIAVGTVALLPVALGALLLAWPLAWVWAARSTSCRPLDSFPAWCTTTWLGIVLFAPLTSQGVDGTEFKHRPFILVYAAIFIWTFVFLNRAAQSGPRQLSSRGRAGVSILMSVALVALLAARWRVDPAQPRVPWGDVHYRTTVDRGLIDAAAFVRAHARRGNIFALVPVDPSATLTDDPTRFAALTDVSAYLARPAIQMTRGPERRAVVELRLAQLTAIAAAEDPDDAFLQLRRLGVTFFVALGTEGPRFDPHRAHAAFRTRGATVYWVAGNSDGDR